MVKRPSESPEPSHVRLRFSHHPERIRPMLSAMCLSTRGVGVHLAFVGGHVHDSVPGDR
jgi:hypothetical protein